MSALPLSQPGEALGLTAFSTAVSTAFGCFWSCFRYRVRCCLRPVSGAREGQRTSPRERHRSAVPPHGKASEFRGDGDPSNYRALPCSPSSHRFGEGWVRLVRLAPQPSRVADGIRAALTALSRGENTPGGVALIGARPLPSGNPVDAAVVLPRGVVVVLGIDLPEPVLRLEAPLDGPWKADGWPVAAPDGGPNPASAKLAHAESVGKALRRALPEGMPVGAILAIGPFVDTVDQPPADMRGSVRVLHPSPTSMLAAVSLASAARPCSAGHARRLIQILAPDAPVISEEELVAEGFGMRDPLSSVTVTLPPPKPPQRPPQPPPPPGPAPIEVTAPAPKITDRPAVSARGRETNSRTVRWLPLGAVGLLAVLLITAIVLATTTGGEGKHASATLAPQLVDGISFPGAPRTRSAMCGRACSAPDAWR